MDYELRAKTEQAISRIEIAHYIAKKSGNTLVLAYSGGKDSDTLLDLARKSGVPFVVEHNHTTADAPETVYHIREKFAELNTLGLTALVNWPPMIKDIDGKEVRASMWNLIVKKGIPPLRTARYCCEYFKERCFEGQHLLLGVRWAESARRKIRGLHETLNAKPENRIVYVDENDDSQKLINICSIKSRVATNPIIDWTDADVWCYIKSEELKINPLYGLGFRRVGCIGCPMAGYKTMMFQFRMYPKYKAMYIRTFDRLIKYHNDNDKPFRIWKDGAAMFDWWIGKPGAGKELEEDIQMSIDELLEGDE